MQKKVPRYRQKEQILKSTDGTGTKKVPRYSTVVQLYSILLTSAYCVLRQSNLTGLLLTFSSQSSMIYSNSNWWRLTRSRKGPFPPMVTGGYCDSLCAGIGMNGI